MQKKSNKVVKTESQLAEGRLVNKFINKFKDINPTYEQLFKRKDQRDSMGRLIKKLGEEKLEKTLNLLPIVNITPFAPNITTPKQLEDKLGNLLAWFKKEDNKNKGNKAIRL